MRKVDMRILLHVGGTFAWRLLSAAVRTTGGRDHLLYLLLALSNSANACLHSLLVFIERYFPMHASGDAGFLLSSTLRLPAAHSPQLAELIICFCFNDRLGLRHGAHAQPHLFCVCLRLQCALCYSCLCQRLVYSTADQGLLLRLLRVLRVLRARTASRPTLR